MMVVVIVMMIIMMVMVVMVIVVVMMVMMVMMVMIILSHYQRVFFSDGRAAFVLGAQNVLSIRNGIQQLGK